MKVGIFFVVTLTCVLLLDSCKVSPCDDLSDPKEGSCTCDNGQQLASVDCPACDGSGTKALGKIENQDLHDSVLALCGRDYTFEVDKNSHMNLQLSDVTGNVTVAVTSRSSKTSIGGTSASPGADSNQPLVLQHGSYAISVTTSSPSSVAFRLELSATAYEVEEPPTDPGTDKTSADDLGELEALQRVGGFVGPTDKEDYYRFELTENSSLAFSASDVQGRVYAQLFPDSSVIDESKPHTQLDAATDRDATTTVDLARGIYFVRVVPVTDPALYKLALSAEPYPQPEPAEDPGDAKESAWDAGKLTKLQEFGGFVGVTDGEDYYRFELSENATATYALSAVSGRVYAQLFEDEPIIDESSPFAQIDATDGANATKSLTLAAGTYYVRVTPVAATNALYTLGLSAEVD